MKIGKLFLASAAVTVFHSLIGMLTCGWLFSWVYALQPTNVWRPMEGPPSVIFYIGQFVLSILFVYFYVLFKNGIPGSNKLAKGLVYGLAVFAVGCLPGMFATHIFMTVATTVVIYWTISGLICTPIAGLIAALVYGDE